MLIYGYVNVWITNLIHYTSLVYVECTIRDEISRFAKSSEDYYYHQPVIDATAYWWMIYTCTHIGANYRQLANVTKSKQKFKKKLNK